jgi:hypothetical protein
MELGVATLQTDLDDALELAGRALAVAETTGRPTLVSVSTSAEALVLGALQRESSVRELCPASFVGASVVRRLSTGTEARLSGALLYHALALPSVRALFPDASPRTLLNRNLRALLRGYAAAGVPLRYFGTEVLALLGQPVALVGYDQLASGAVLIELLIGLENPCVVRPALKREPPAALYRLLGSQPAPSDLLQRAAAGICERLGAEQVDVSSALRAAPPLAAPGVLPESSSLARVPIPLGFLEAVAVPSCRITGDLLASVAALSRVEALADAALAARGELSEAVLQPLQGAPLDGARAQDILRVLELAAASVSSAPA